MKLIIIAMIANASLFAFEWDHVRGICESKNECGEIITISHIKHGDMDLIKRVVGLPKDHIEYKDKVIYVNGKTVLGL